MELLTLLIVTALFLIIGTPIGLAIALGMITISFAFGSFSLTFISQSLFTGLESIPLLAVPCFMLAGSLMETGGLSKRIIDVAKKLTAHTTGGLGNVTVLACLFFGAISGSGPATVAAIGGIMIPYMAQAGYDRSYGTGLSAVAGALGVIIPPSVPMVVYALSTQASVSDLFLSGFIPGFIIAAVLIGIHTFIIRKNKNVVREEKATLKELFTAVWDAKWALFMPFIILGGIYGGVFTPTEAAVAAIAYSVLVGLFIYRELTVGMIWKTFVKTASFVAGFMMTFAPAAALGSVLLLLGLPKILTDSLLSFTSDINIIMLFMFIFLLFLGMILDTISSIVIFAPIMYAVLIPMGIHPTHLGIIMVVSLAVGFITPPVCMNIFVASSMTKIPMEQIIKKALPFMLGLIFVCLLIIYVPQLSLFLIRG